MNERKIAGTRPAAEDVVAGVFLKGEGPQPPCRRKEAESGADVFGSRAGRTLAFQNVGTDEKGGRMAASQRAGGSHAVLMKGSTVGRLNAPWKKVLHLAEQKVIRKGQSVDIRTGLSRRDGRPCFYYVVSGRIRLSYVSRSGEERTILYAGPETLMNVPSVIVGDEDNTLVTCTQDAEVALFDAALLSDEGFAAAHPDLMINLVHSLCVHMVIHSQRLAETSLTNSVAQVCRVIRELSERHGGRAVLDRKSVV